MTEMSEASELEQRVHAALDRIEAAARALTAPAADDTPEPADTDAPAGDLNAELEAERMANAQLEERVRAIKEKQETLVGRLERDVADLRAALAARDGALQKVRQMNSRLRRNNRALRTANAAQLGDAALVNEGLEAEVDALKALYDTDRAELDEVLATLAPAVEEVRHA